jgi:hypothetical protein
MHRARVLSNSNVLGGSSNVLGGFGNVLGGSSNVLGGSFNVLGGSGNVLGGSGNVLGGLMRHRLAGAGEESLRIGGEFREAALRAEIVGRAAVLE